MVTFTFPLSDMLEIILVSHEQKIDHLKVFFQFCNELALILSVDRSALMFVHLGIYTVFIKSRTRQLIQTDIRDISYCS